MLPDHLSPDHQPWLREESLRRVLQAIQRGGGEARVVGGAVRDALLGRAVKEIDLAVNLPPDKVTELLQASGIKVKPTGIEHGTVMAVLEGKAYEITTLRHDLETDGRHAKVAFTDDWQADAARRDFTINALYADSAGRLYDYFGGRDDLAAGRVRFIGDARARIREDVLRILRFFRFTACFAHGDADAEGLAACRELAHLIPQLSVERVWREIIKLLAATHPAPVWGLMLESDVLRDVLPQAQNVRRLQALLDIEKKNELTSPPLMRLAALLPHDLALATEIAQHLKLSKREAEKLSALVSIPPRLNGKLDPIPFRRALYEFGLDDTRDGLLLLAAEHPSLDIEPALATAATWENPVFPLRGTHLLKLGLTQGSRVGGLLKDIEAWWIADDFLPDLAACLAEAQRRL